MLLTGSPVARNGWRILRNHPTDHMSIA